MEKEQTAHRTPVERQQQQNTHTQIYNSVKMFRRAEAVLVVFLQYILCTDYTHYNISLYDYICQIIQK